MPGQFLERPGGSVETYGIGVIASVWHPPVRSIMSVTALDEGRSARPTRGSGWLARPATCRQETSTSAALSQHGKEANRHHQV